MIRLSGLLFLWVLIWYHSMYIVVMTNEKCFQFSEPSDPTSSYEDGLRMDRHNPSPWSVGISPNSKSLDKCSSCSWVLVLNVQFNIVDGPFKPFIHYLVMIPYSCSAGDSSYYRWETSEHGWLPGYMNASFSWFYCARFRTTYEVPLICSSLVFFVWNGRYRYPLIYLSRTESSQFIRPMRSLLFGDCSQL